MNNIKSNSAYGEEQARKTHGFNRKWVEEQFQKIDVLIRNTSKLIELLEPKEERLIVDGFYTILMTIHMQLKVIVLAAEQVNLGQIMSNIVLNVVRN